MRRPANLKISHIVRRYTSQCKKKKTPAELLEAGQRCLANNYYTLPIIVERGKGTLLYDVDGKEYLDFVSGDCSVSLGHSHPKICYAIAEQIKQITLTKRTFLTRALVEFGEFLTDLLGYEKVLPANTGNEACEAAVKLARRWGYRCKGIGPNQAKVLFPENNSWGNSIAAISASTTAKIFRQFGPFVPCFDTVPFNNIDALYSKLSDPNVCAFMVEPIQADGGVVIPDPCYLRKVKDLCSEKKVLMIADELQCGLGRAGCMLACDIYKVKPDILIIGQGLSGGFMPVSAVLANSDIMDLLEPGSHSSTYGGNPLACRIALGCLKVLQDEKLICNSKQMGEALRGLLCDLPKDLVSEVRGVGLLNAIVLNEGISGSGVVLNFMRNGLLAGLKKDNIISLCPPLSVKEREVQKAAKIIRRCIEDSRGSCDGDKKDPCAQEESIAKRSKSFLIKFKKS